MNLSNRIYTRKVFYRIVYMFNFYKSILSKNIYINFADKIENIVNYGLDKLSPEDFLKYDFSKLLISKKITLSNEINLEEYISFFDSKNEKKFLSIVSYVSDNVVLAKHKENLELDYLFSCMSYLWDNYDIIPSLVDEYLPKFKFFELNSITQSILLLAIIENKVIKTPKSILIKEAIFLADAFDSNNSIRLINAVLDKVLN